jgi:cobalt-zinc-cadmium efflux system outer membrane protein
MVLLAAWSQDGLAQPAPPREGFTVDELVDYAIANNPELAASRADVEAAMGRLRQAGLRPNPTLEMTGQQNVAGPDNNVTVGVTLPLDLNGRKEGRVAVAERELEIKRAQVAERERRLRADLRRKAGDRLAAARNLEFTEALLTVNRDALGLVGKRVREGAAPALEESLALVEANRLDAARQMLESRVAIAELELKALAGLGPDVPLQLRAGFDLPVTVSRDRALGLALGARPDLRTVDAEVARARARIGREEAEGRWDASISVGYQRQEMGFNLNGLTDRGGTRPIQDTFNMVGGGVSITLPVRNRNQGNVQAARSEMQAAEHRREIQVLIVRQEVAAAFTQHAAAMRALEIYARGVRDVARRNLDVVRGSYGLGRTSLLEVIAEQRRYIEVETGYTDALKQAYDAAVEIERVIGTAVR